MPLIILILIIDYILIILNALCDRKFYIHDFLVNLQSCYGFYANFD